jgi:four helix bundle protein
MDSAIAAGMPKSHTELICWQLSDELRQLIIEHTNSGAAAKDFRFTSNLRDAIASACRNQSEGFHKYKHSQQRPYFNTAQGSLGETKDGIIDGLERGYFSPELAERMQKLCKRAMGANLRWLKSLDRPDPL